MIRSEFRRVAPALAFVAIAFIGAASAARAQDTVVTAGLNVQFVSGSFGSAQTTRLVYAPAMIRIDTGRFEIAGDPAGVDLRNAASWAVGTGRRLPRRVYLLASAYGSSAILPGFSAPI